ncbi:hypothetical protein BGZ61DRAFT_162854 [Ilyonectria robusta]|uniref:uncharacterized protein n=1 Tax=Ilyonectria robusta TaxID=1079257 RepID=UPI001E8CA144|nr:uncharacterized protein BGZ61DRAFT_162854 [Ilyonectria robusta]KAH8733578.1 hypothetical protein BGZ61DRAFT_162854 [Ilyonectria robusta]
MASMMAAGPEVAPLSLPQKRNRVQPVQPLQLQTPKQKQKQKQKLKQIQTQIQGQNQSHLQTTLQPPPVPVSRYRTLRGKSVSSITRRRAFDVYNDGFGPINSNLTTGDCYPQLDSPTLSSPRVTRRRSKSVASLPTQRPKSPKASKAPKSPKVPKSPKLSKSPMLPKSSSSWPALPVLPALPSSPAPSWTPPPPPSRGPSPNPSSMLSSPVLPYDDPGVTVAAGGLADSVSGSLSSRLGGLVPRAAVGAVGHGPLPHRPASPSPASMDRLQAPSPVPPLPRPLALTPKPTAAPASAAPAPAAPSSAASSVLAPSRSREGLFNLRPKSKSKSKSRPKSKSKSSAPPIPSSPIPVPSSPVPSPVDEVARRKAFNLRSFRLNADTTGRAAQLERDNAERRRDEEQEAERWAAEVARLEAETDRIIAEQKKRDAARVRAKVNTPPPKLSKYLIFDKLPFLSRGRRSNATNSQNGTPSPKAPTVFSLEYNRASRASSLEDSLTSDEMSFIEQGGRGIVPNHDAPTSASNGGERRVTVRCLSSTINLPVTPDTSPVDVLYSTANLTAHDIDPKTSVIVECYVDLGLERRLRRYERIRDVMNSWDRDQQNSLLVLTYDISENDADADLELNSVPRTPNPPTGFTLQLYHSSRPGKWNKRWITLLESGQMFSSKKPEAKASDKDSTVLCHLSDFDIYTPRESEVKRHLKAPRRFCYAVKSQQKTVVFPNGENFVHFFCAEDAQLAQRFHELVQRWRSWYLVTKQVDFEKKPKPYERVVPDKPPRISQSSFPTQKGNITKSISTVTNGSHRLKVSVDESPYTIGAFQPLMDLNRFDKPIEDFGKDFEVVPPPKPKPVVQKPKVQKPKILTKQGSRASHTPQTPQTGSEFSPGGLLGNGYEQKRMQAEQAERSERASNGSQIQTSGPFTDAPSLINSIVTSPVSPPREKKPEPRPWLPSASEHSARSRSKSVHSTQRVPMADNNVGAPNPGLAAIPSSLKQKPQPLVNLTNSFPEPPRWRESQGGAHRAPTSGGPLINFATGGPAATMSPIGPGLIRSSTRGGTLHNTSKAPLTGSVTLNSISTPPISSANILPRSRSSAGMPPPSFRAPPPSFRAPPPPVPPLPNRSVRREKTQPIEPPRGRDPRPREPLINRAGSSGLSSMSRY